MASTIASTLCFSRPSEKFGTHSTMVCIREKNRWRELSLQAKRQIRNGRIAERGRFQHEFAHGTIPKFLALNWPLRLWHGLAISARWQSGRRFRKVLPGTEP